MASFAPRFMITNAMTAGLTRVERARGFLEAAILSDDWVRRMSQRALLLEAHHTTHIEGTQLTLAQSAELWAGRTVEAAQPDDVRELLNYRGAFELVSEHLLSGTPITETLVREIHRRLVEGVRGGHAQPGAYRTIQNYVGNARTGKVIYVPPPPADVPALMQELVGWLGTDTPVHPVLVAGIAQFQLVHVHPFVDGNGRTSRLLSTLCLYRAGYDFKRLFTISELYDRDRAAFYRAIQSVREADMDLTGWLEFFVGGLATQLDEVKARGIAAIRAHLIAGEHKLKPRTTAVLAEIVIAARTTLAELETAFPSAVRRTLQRDLKLLVDRGLVRQDGVATDPNRAYVATIG